jgi:hypothetical protein
MARITMTTMISIRVKPLLLVSLFIEQHPPLGVVLQNNGFYMKGPAGTRVFDLPADVSKEIPSASIGVFLLETVSGYTKLTV